MHQTAWTLVGWLAAAAFAAATARGAELEDLVVVASSVADGRVIVREGSGPPAAKKVGDTLLGERYVIRSLLLDSVALGERPRPAASPEKRTPPAFEIRVYVAGPDGRSRVQRFESLPRDVPIAVAPIHRFEVGTGPSPPTRRDRTPPAPVKRPQTKP